MTEGNKKSGKLWGGRFSGRASGVAEDISVSIHFDSRLYRQDIRGSRAHARMLARIGVLSPTELDDILKGLDGIEAEIESGAFRFSRDLEDIHMNIEAALTEKIGEAGRKLHTGRSRNDQVALDVRMYVMDQAAHIGGLIADLARILTERAARHIDCVLPGYTHLQVAQPVRLGHHLLVYAWGLLRDLDRLHRAANEASRLPLGSGALAGLNYPTDREFLRTELGFRETIPNSMDAVSDRDFVLDFLYFGAVIGTRLSRLCEELVLWSSAEFGYVRLSDAVTTGSSIMPQKRNPDVAELTRGKTGRLYGNLISLLTVLKGLPLAYNRDFQEDKEPLFDTVDTVTLCLRGVAEMIDTMEVNESKMRAAAFSNYSTATDLADYLASKGVPFRSAHEIVGAIVRHCEENGEDFFSMGADGLRNFSPLFADDAAGLLDPESSPERKLSPGSTARGEVEKQIETLRTRLDALSGR